MIQVAFRLGRQSSVSICLWGTLAILLFPALPRSAAQTTAEPAVALEAAEVTQPLVDELPSLEEVQARIESIESDDALDEATKALLLKSANDTLSSLKSIIQTQQSIAKLKGSADTATERKEQRRRVLDQPTNLVAPVLPEGAGLEQLKARKTELQATLTELTRQSEMVQETIRTRREEQQQLPQMIAQLRAEIEELQKPGETADDASPTLVEAADGLRKAALAVSRSELDLATQKIATYEAEAELLPLQATDVQRRMDQVRSQLEELSLRLSNERKVKISSQILEFKELVRKTSADLPPNELPLMVETNQVVSAWPEMVDVAQIYEAKAVDLQGTGSALKSDFEKTQSLIETDLATGGGLSQSVGFLLQRKRAKLPDNSTLAKSRVELSEAIERTQAVLARTDTILDELPTQQSLNTSPETYQQAVAGQREILQRISNDAERLLLDTLIPLGVKQDTNRALIDKYKSLIDEHLLWVRSDSPFRLNDLTEAWDSTTWLFDRNHTATLANAASYAFRKDPLTVITWFLVIVLLFAIRPWFSRLITNLGEQAQKRTSMQMKSTFEALGSTIMLSLPVALCFGLPGQLLRNSPQNDSFGMAFGDALVTVSALILPLEFLRQFIRPCGIAVAHFGWPPAAIKPVRRAIRSVMFGFLPLIFVWRILDAHSEQPQGTAALARIVFTALMIFAAFLLWRVSHPRRGAVTVLVMAKPNGWIEKLRWIWHPLLAIVPIGLAILMLLGYGYSAIQLAYRLYNTIWIFIIALALFGLAIRWLTISRRHLAIQQLRERPPTKGQAVGTEGPHAEVLDDKQADLSAINQQSRRLVNAAIFVAILAGLYYTWSPVLPALGFLERVPLWEQVGDDGTVLDTITLANLLLAIPMLALTFVVVRNAPGLLETTLLQRLPLENAVRYAITTLTSYLLAGVGITLAASTLGLHWSSIQWLVAGLGVGLGFGLQEIFANFISGIILLFEQPIRVGDIVTLDGTTGIISRIRMRATTITNWDRQEYVVPNKDFITGRLVNWTLTDTTNRVVVNVGIAYGSDTRKACEILQQVCDDHPNVLGDPAPLISFEGFGDSTLNIVLRFYLANLDRRLAVIHEVHTDINDRFNAAGVEIAFPQRDLHIRSLPESFKLPT